RTSPSMSHACGRRARSRSRWGSGSARPRRRARRRGSRTAWWSAVRSWTRWPRAGSTPLSVWSASSPPPSGRKPSDREPPGHDLQSGARHRRAGRAGRGPHPGSALDRAAARAAGAPGRRAAAARRAGAVEQVFLSDPDRIGGPGGESRGGPASDRARAGGRRARRGLVVAKEKFLAALGNVGREVNALLGSYGVYGGGLRPSSRTAPGLHVELSPALLLLRLAYFGIS